MADLTPFDRAVRDAMKSQLLVRRAADGAYPDDIVDRLSADRAAYVPDDADLLTPEQLYAEDVAEEYRREAWADRWAS